MVRAQCNWTGHRCRKYENMAYMRKVASLVILFAALTAGADSPVSDSYDAFHFQQVVADQNPEDYERVLVPITTRTVHGVGGAIWSTELRIFNSAHETLTMFGPSVDPSLVVDVLQTETELIAPRTGNVDGAFLHIPKSLATAPKFALRVRDTSGGKNILGSEMPVVPVEEFTNEITFVDLPWERRFRGTLRIYSENEAPMQVLVTVYLEDGNTPREQFTVDLHGIVHALPDPFPTHPAYAAIQGITPGMHSGRNPSRITISNMSSIITPAPAKIWAMLSITDNETQQVTVLTPQ